MKNVLMLLLAFVILVPSASGQKLKAEEIIAKHLSSIATPEKLSSVKSLIAVGEVKVDFITPKNQPTSGRIVLTSQAGKSFFGMQLTAIDYPREMIIFDGSKTDVAMVRAGTRSSLGNFIQSNSAIVSQGLMGGTLMTSWNLLAAAQGGAKITTSGTRKVNGKEAYVLSIVLKGGSDLDITMFFDQKNFQHLRTEYKRTSSAAMGRTIDESARNSETRIKVTEDFSDHQDYQGIVLPRKYKLYYSISGQNGTTEIAWTGEFTEFALNPTLDPATFGIKP
ncbi:MAG: hypothetical protein IPO41_04790 [Acidobacteria bacterium]|nr:hypothetical protein [Acidobacteriota bacterium]